MITQDITRFEFDSQELRTTTVDGEPLFCGKDVALILGYKDTVNAIKLHCRGVVKRHPIVDSLGRIQEATFITEPDLYRLIVNSKLPAAEKFEKLVFEEVLPSIRKTGGYMDPDALEKFMTAPETVMKIAANWKKDRDKRLELEAKVQADAPKVLFADAVATSKTSILIGEFAKILKGNGVEIGQNRLFQWLRENGYLCKAPGDRWNMPTQKSLDLGLFRIKESTTQSPDGDIRVHKTPKLTGKGQQYFADKFLTRAIVDIAGEAVAS